MRRKTGKKKSGIVDGNHDDPLIAAILFRETGEYSLAIVGNYQQLKQAYEGR